MKVADNGIGQDHIKNNTNRLINAYGLGKFYGFCTQCFCLYAIMIISFDWG